MRARSRTPSRWGRTRPPMLFGELAPRAWSWLKKARKFFNDDAVAPELLRPLAELRDPIILVDPGAAVPGKRALARLLVFPRPPPERRVLGPKLTRKVDGPRLAAEGHPSRRYLDLLVVALPLLGHREHLSPLTWCPINLTLST